MCRRVSKLGKTLRGAAVTIAVTALVLLNSAWAEAFRHLSEGDVVPGFKLQTVGGQDVEFAAPPEVAVVLSFVRMGQEKSEAVMRELAKLDPAIAEKTQVLTLITNPGEGDPVEWVKTLGVQYPVLLDKGEEVYSKYGVMVAPQTAIIAPDGKLKGEIGGHTADFKPALEEKLREVLGMPKLEDKSAAVEKDQPPERKKAMRELAKAQVLLKRKMKTKAIPQLKESIASDDKYVEPKLLLAELLLDEGGPENLAEAEAQVNKAVEVEPNNTGAKIGLARVKAAKGDYEGAVATLEEAAKITPKPAKIYYFLGRMHQDAGKMDKAAEAYRHSAEKLLDSEN